MVKRVKTLLTACIAASALFSTQSQAVCVKDGFCDRPIQLGVSIANTPSAPFVYAGTAGLRVHLLGNPNVKMILSNNHVLGAVAPDLCPNTADVYPPPMTWSIQPGSLDLGFDPGNDPSYLVGLVFKIVPIDFTPGARNRVDAAIAYTTPAFTSSEILGLGQPNPVLGTAVPGMAITKSGRTTGVTTGNVLAVNTTVDVSYGSCGTATFDGQIITSAGLGSSGDSGSVVLDQASNTPVGLYFAGSAFSGVMNPIIDVYTSLRVFVDTDAPPAVASAAELREMAANMKQDEKISALMPVQKRHEGRLLSVPGVNGVGIGMDEAGDKPVLMVFHERLSDDARSAIPAEVEGVRIRLVESGKFVAH